TLPAATLVIADHWSIEHSPARLLPVASTVPSCRSATECLRPAAMRVIGSSKSARGASSAAHRTWAPTCRALLEVAADAPGKATLGWSLPMSDRVCQVSSLATGPYPRHWIAAGLLCLPSQRRPSQSL